jgi:ATP-dependent Clp protease ATP-binding subunit ClpA/plasmid stability protein
VATLHVRNVPDPLYEALRECADSAGRSIGAQAVEILMAALAPHRMGRGVLRRRMPGRRLVRFERFTQKARAGVVFAQEEARGLAHNYVGTEHLLLGLLRVEDSVAARTLARLGVEEQAFRARVEELIGRGTETAGEQIPFTPRAKKIFELALREALALRHDFIGTEHLLLAIVKEGEGVAARVLREQQIEEPQVRSVVLNVLAREPRAQFERAPAAETEEQAYLAVDLDGGAEQWTERLNGLADEGWELVSLQQLGTGTRAVLRRAE